MSGSAAATPSTADRLAAAGGWPGVLNRLIDGQDLDGEVVSAIADTVLGGEAAPSQIAAFLVALRAKGESAGELAAMLSSALATSERVPLTEAEQSAALDIVGTGGDGSNSINVSTMAAIVVASTGVLMCKHGNRGSSSACGAADVLEELGVAIALSPAGVAHCIRTAGIGFCLATSFHPAFRHAGPTRREIGVRTAFNLVGPMANPGRVRNLLIGVADSSKAEIMAAALRDGGATSAWVVHGNGLDELTTTGVSDVVVLRDGELDRMRVDPSTLGLAPATLDDLRGGDAAFNAAAVHGVLGGERGPGRDIVLLNAAAGLVVAGRAADLESGLQSAAAAIDSGAAAATLTKLVAASTEAAATDTASGSSS